MRLYLGADMPTCELLHLLREQCPDLLGLSLSVYLHLNTLLHMDAVRAEFPILPILIGGQGIAAGRAESGAGTSGSLCGRSRRAEPFRRRLGSDCRIRFNRHNAADHSGGRAMNRQDLLENRPRLAGF